MEDVRRQVNEAIEARQVSLGYKNMEGQVFWSYKISDWISLVVVSCLQKIDRMYAAFTGQPLETVQQYTERDRFLSASEVTMIPTKSNTAHHFVPLLDFAD